MSDKIHYVKLLYNDEYFKPITNNEIPNICIDRYIISNYGRIYDKYTQRLVIGYMDAIDRNIHIRLYNTEGAIIDGPMHKLMAIMFINNVNGYKYTGLVTENARSLLHENNIMWTDKETSDLWLEQNISYSEFNGQRLHCGEASNFIAKLNPEKVREICRLLQENKLTLKEIGDKFNVTEHTIYRIKNRDCWKHISKDFDLPPVIPLSERHGVNGPTTKYSEETIRRICELLEKDMYTNVQISNMLNVHEYLVSSVKCGKTWKSISSQYNIPEVKHKL